MSPFRKKKALGQHFLTNDGIAQKIADSLPTIENASILEVGPGLGALTRHLLGLEGVELRVVELDEEAIAELKKAHPELGDRVIQSDFLDLDLERLPEGPLILTGNFPYSISSPILVRMAEERDRIGAMVGMFQKEFADRVRAEPGSRTYGRISVLLQTFFDVELLFHVEPGSFSPPPKVRSSVIRAVRNERKALPCDEDFYFEVVKQAFGQRRKTLRNALKGIAGGKELSDPLFDRRAEELGVEEFIRIASFLEEK